MDGPIRVTGPFLDVVALLWAAHLAGERELHGWAIITATKRPGPTVYGVLDRLEDMGWIAGRWEIQPPDQASPRKRQASPRKRFYSLTPTGLTGAQDVLRQRRPGALQPAPPLLPGWRPVPRQAGAQ